MRDKKLYRSEGLTLACPLLMFNNVLALIYCACLFSLALTTSTPPKITRPPRLDVFRAARLSPLASLGVLVAGFAMLVFRMVGPIYGLEVGLDQEQIGYYLGAGFLGGALIQIPIGYIADRFDRRLILIFLSLAASVVCIVIAMSSFSNISFLYLLAFYFGATTMPIFQYPQLSLTISHRTITMSI